MAVGMFVERLLKKIDIEKSRLFAKNSTFSGLQRKKSGKVDNREIEKNTCNLTYNSTREIGRFFRGRAPRSRAQTDPRNRARTRGPRAVSDQKTRVREPLRFPENFFA